MKNIYFILLLAVSSSFYSQQASTLAVHDTRSTNDLPSTYHNEVKAEFKLKGVVGIPGDNTYSGMLTIAPWSDDSGGKIHQMNFNADGIFYRNAFQSSNWGSWNKILTQDVNGNVGIGTLGSAESKLDINANGSIPIIRGNGGYIPAGIKFRDDSYTSSGQIREWAIYKGNGWLKGLGFMRYDAVNACGSGICDVPLILLDDGNVHIGTPQKSLTVRSKVEIWDNVKVDAKLEAKEVKVTQAPTADFVFADTYELPKLEDVEKHIKKSKHLPEIASAKEMEKEGVNIGEFQIKLLQKIEELTLYSIEQNKQIKFLLERVEKLESISNDKKTN